VSRVEKILAGGFIGAAMPLTLMVIGWWGSAWLLLAGLLPVTDAQIALTAQLGLLLGLLLDVLLLRSWVRFFYQADLRLIAMLYLFWIAVATAFFMGLPFGNLMLGTAAGAYVGRRAVIAATPGADRSRLVGQASLFTASITSAAALGIGLLAAQEPYTLAPFRRLLGIEQGPATLMVDLVIVVVAVVLLAAIQFWLTRLSAVLAMRPAPEH
jgi:hypothetical protein